MGNLVSLGLAKEEAPLLAAREIVKCLDGMEAFELPIEYYSEDDDDLHSLDYDDVVEMFAGIIRHFFGVQPDGEQNPFTS
jgi:hypothetical protein